MRSFAPVILSTLALTAALWLVGPIFGAFVLNFIGSLIIGRRLIEEIYGNESKETGRKSLPSVEEKRKKEIGRKINWFVKNAGVKTYLSKWFKQVPVVALRAKGAYLR